MASRLTDWNGSSHRWTSASKKSSVERNCIGDEGFSGMNGARVEHALRLRMASCLCSRDRAALGAPLRRRAKVVAAFAAVAGSDLPAAHPPSDGQEQKSGDHE